MADAAQHGGGRRLTIAVSGSTGLVGAALCAALETDGHRVIHLRRSSTSGDDERTWDPLDPDAALLDGVDCVVHLAGASIDGRFTARHKRAVRDSRIEPTRQLAALAADQRIESFVCASAIGYYGASRRGETLTEESQRGSGFLADVVADWEAAAETASAAGVRTVVVRTGIVLSSQGGALAKLKPLFQLGLGGWLGDGRQTMSWIGLDDLIGVYRAAITDPGLSGAVNAVAPQPVSNREFTRILAGVLRRPAVLPVPAFGPALLLGREGAAEIALADQDVQPAKLLARGHEFRHGDLESALRHALDRPLRA